MPSKGELALQLGATHFINAAETNPVEAIKELLPFSPEMPDGPFHLVLCRNLAFTYFDADRQREILRGIDERLVAGGYLLVGALESFPEGTAPDLVERPERARLWQKLPEA